MSRLASLFKPVLIIAAILLIIQDVVGFFAFSSESTFSAVATTGTYAAISVLGLLAIYLVLLSIILLHLRQADASGGYGLVAFLLAILGVLLVFGASWTQTFAAPVLALQAPALLDGEPPGLLNIGYQVSFFGASIGLVLFGIAILLAGVFSRVGAALLIVAAIVLALPFVPIGGTTLLGIGLIWLAVTPARERAAAMA